LYPFIIILSVSIAVSPKGTKDIACFCSAHESDVLHQVFRLWTLQAKCLLNWTCKFCLRV